MRRIQQACADDGSIGLDAEVGLRGFDFQYVQMLFYVMYLVVEVPSNLIFKRVGSIWLACLVIGFGVTSIGTAFIQTKGQLYATRVSSCECARESHLRNPFAVPSRHIRGRPATWILLSSISLLQASRIRIPNRRLLGPVPFSQRYECFCQAKRRY
jgi:hypothetical protein